MFLAILSHDLRNPLHTIRMAAHVVSQQNTNPATANAISVIARNTDAMMQLIGDLIDFSSTGLGRAMPLNRGPVDLEALCREVIDSFRALHPGRALRLHSEGDVNGVWDAGRIRQVVSNLIGNAIQHGSPDAPIDLSVASKGTASAGSGLGGSTVVLRVDMRACRSAGPFADDLRSAEALRDAGISSGAESGSIGLGLYIVREIVVAKGGTVEVASTAEEKRTHAAARRVRASW